MFPKLLRPRLATHASQRRTPGPATASRQLKRSALPALCALTVTLGALSGCSSHRNNEAPWQLTNVTGHLPDLDFSLTADDGKPVTGATFRGHTSLVYFGYTHCPDVCPETMARLMQVIAALGPDAQQVRILFITVDPARDTATALHDYIGAFDPKHAIGLTGSDAQIESLAKRYRIAYQMEKRDAGGNYEVTHSSAVYVFDAQGHARLLATDHDTPEAVARDLRRIIEDRS